MRGGAAHRAPGAGPVRTHVIAAAAAVGAVATGTLTALLPGTPAPAESPAVDDSGAAKLWVTSRTLRLRRDTPDAFETYTPLTAEGSAADHLLAFDRGGAITLATRLPVGLARRGGWGDTTLALSRPVRDELTGATFEGTVQVADLLATYPVALLVKSP